MAHVPSFVSVPEAQRIVLDRVQSLPRRDEAVVPLDAALGMTLAADVFCDMDAPAFDRAMMDGFAVQGGDVRHAPVVLEVVGRVMAGGAAGPCVRSGTAVQINTGAPMPDGADTVVKVEDTVASSDGMTVTVVSPQERGQHICRRAEYRSSGDRVLCAGTWMGPLEIAAAAAAGAAEVRVHAPPRVAVLVTGDEVVDVTVSPVGSQIRNSNGPALLTLLRQDGLAPLSLGVAGDDKAELARKIGCGLEGDCLCITGGVSMGAADLVPEVLLECGVTFHFRRIATKPGRPTVFGTSKSNCCVFALPGNPVSAFVSYVMFVRPALAAMQGRSQQLPQPLIAELHGESAATDVRTSYWPAIVAADDGRLVAQALPWSGSGDSFGMAGANGLIVRPPHSQAAATGEPVSVLMLGWPVALGSTSVLRRAPVDRR